MIDGYVTLAGAERDYGVVVRAVDPELDRYEIDGDATGEARARIRSARLGWLETDPADIARRYRAGELETADLVRRYGVIVDWGTGELHPATTAEYRELLRRRAVAHWT